MKSGVNAPTFLVTFLTSAVCQVATSSATSTLSGTPANIPLEADCAIRHLAWEYGQHLLPERGSFKTLFDALQLTQCNVTVPSKADTYIPPWHPMPAEGIRLFVATSGDDASADGTIDKPFASLDKAVKAASAARPAKVTILVRGGSYHLSAPLELTAAHSGLTIHNYNGERVRVSGGVAFSIPKKAWAPYKQHVGWEHFDGINNVYGQVKTPGQGAEGIVFIGKMANASACAAAVEALERRAVARGSTGYTAWTYHETSFGGGFEQQCFGRTDGAWAPVPQEHVASGLLVRKNVWVASIKGMRDKSSGGELHAALPEGMPGLRKDGERAIRAKYPNGDPERSGQFLRGASQGMGGGDYVCMPRARSTAHLRVTAFSMPSAIVPCCPAPGTRMDPACSTYRVGAARP